MNIIEMILVCISILMFSYCENINVSFKTEAQKGYVLMYSQGA